MEDLLLDSNLYSVNSEDSFDVANLSQYRLCLRVHQSSLAIGVYEAETNRCLALEAYQFDRSLNTTALIVRLHNIIERHGYVNAAFWKEVVVVLAHQHFNIAPSSFVEDEEAAVSLLRMNSRVHLNQEKVHMSTISSLDSKLIYTVDEELRQFFEQLYTNSQVRFVHSLEPFLKGIQPYYRKNTLYLHADLDSICIAKLKEANALEFVNLFNYKTDQDFIYFLLFVMEELKLDPKKTEVVFWGEVSSKSSAIHLLKKYVKKVYFGKRPSSLKFTYEFDQEPEEHMAFEVLNSFFL